LVSDAFLETRSSELAEVDHRGEVRAAQITTEGQVAMVSDKRQNPDGSRQVRGSKPCRPIERDFERTQGLETPGDGRCAEVGSTG